MDIPQMGNPPYAQFRHSLAIINISFHRYFISQISGVLILLILTMYLVLRYKASMKSMKTMGYSCITFVLFL